ncbi:major facilitator superfamily domain-containing protein [Sparassis latifolia]
MERCLSQPVERENHLDSDGNTGSINKARPWGLKWRCSTWFVTLGRLFKMRITTDLLVYSIIVPIMPFHLEHLEYSGVSGLVGWLLFGYVITPPIALFSERYKSRKTPLIIGLFALVGAQIMLMEAPKYWVMVLARILQGMSSSVVWVVGLALLCDTVPEAIVGRQLGLAMSGLSLGFLVGPSVSGALYNAFGFHGPFIFGVIVTMVDLFGRLLIIERKKALLWGVDPAAVMAKDDGVDKEEKTFSSDVHNAQTPPTAIVTEIIEIPAETTEIPADDAKMPYTLPSLGGGTDPMDAPTIPERGPALLTVLASLGKSSRALSVFATTLIYGILYTSQEPALPLYLQAQWNFNASKVGLVYIAAVVPTVFSSALTGWLSDRIGTAGVTVLCLALSLPWFSLLIIRGALAFFIVVYALANFFSSGVVSPLTAELAAVTRGLDGVGYAHVYGAFNLAYGIGSALGPLIGGQIYEHVKHGWTTIWLLATGLAVVSMALAFCYFEEVSLLSKFIHCVDNLITKRGR